MLAFVEPTPVLAIARLAKVLRVHVFAALVWPPPPLWLSLLLLLTLFQLLPSAFVWIQSSGPPLIYPWRFPSATEEADFPDLSGPVPTARTVSSPPLALWSLLLPSFLAPPQPLALPSYWLEQCPCLLSGFGRL